MQSKGKENSRNTGLLKCLFFDFMTIKLNNKEHQLNSNNTLLSSFLKDSNFFFDTGVAIAINDEIVPKNQWDKHLLKENDNILIITAVQGG